MRKFLNGKKKIVKLRTGVKDGRESQSTSTVAVRTLICMQCESQCES